MSESYYSPIARSLYGMTPGAMYSNQMFRNVMYTANGLRSPVTVRGAARRWQKERGICLNKQKQFWEL